jgi:citrate lyase subunit beta/citryl-CoA lyase
VPDQTATAARSYLYVPGDQPARLQRAAERGADVLIIDLEDSVAPSAKDDARTHAGRWITAASRSSGPVWVRVNPGQAAADIAATVWPGVTGVVVPKAVPALLVQVGELLGQREPEIGLPAGALAMLALIETAAGLLAAPAIAAAERVARLGIGEADLAAELNLQPGPGREELTRSRQWPARSAAPCTGWSRSRPSGLRAWPKEAAWTSRRAGGPWPPSRGRSSPATRSGSPPGRPPSPR